MMTHVDATPRGLRLTIRHQMILVVYFALLFFVLHQLGLRAVAPGWEDAASWALLLSPWLLGALEMLLDQPGPVRNWLVSGLFMSFSPALVIQHDYFAFRGLLETGRLAHPVITLLFNVFFLGSFAVYWHYMGIARCPRCERGALIPLMRLWGQTPRTSNTRWCASCGSLLWKHADGSWRPERRRTWLADLPQAVPQEASSDDVTDSPAPFPPAHTAPAPLPPSLDPTPNPG